MLVGVQLADKTSHASHEGDQLDELSGLVETAGATVVGVGSAVWRRGVEVFGQINAELAAFMAQHGYPSVASLRRVSIQRG